MWEVVNRITIRDEDFFKKISLGIQRDACVQIGECFYHDFWYDREDTYDIYVTTYIDEQCNEKEVLSTALEKIKIPNIILTFLTGYPIGINYRYLGIKYHVKSKKRCTNSKNINVVKLKRFNDLYMQLSENNKDMFERLAQQLAYADYMYYKIDCKDEAAFNAVKALEMISSKKWNEEYNKRFSNKRKEEYLKLVNKFEEEVKIKKKKLYSDFFGISVNDINIKGIKAKAEESLKSTNEDIPLIYKLNYMVREYKHNKNYSVDSLQKLVNFRNDFAHGNIVNYSNDDLDMIYGKSRELASELISNVFFNMTYKKLGLKLITELYPDVKMSGN